jgi:hypothetical protein
VAPNVGWLYNSVISGATTRRVQRLRKDKIQSNTDIYLGLVANKSSNEFLVK